MLLRSLLLAAVAPLLALAQDDGSVTGATSSAAAAGYSCDPTKCKLPTCNCASPNPPGGLNGSDVPMFVVFTADDAVQSYTLDAVNQFLGHRQNPNGCQPKMTYYVSINFTNFTLVTDWYVAGNEIADHTMTHVGDPPQDEVDGNLIVLNALAGIPLSSIQGFRAPFLNYSVDTLKMLAGAGFTYDSSSAAAIPVTDPGTDAYWPYTLDNGMANDCLDVEGSCKGQPVLPGFWEFPMYAYFDQRGENGIHLMDPWLDNANGENAINDTATLEYMKATPIGLYTHPIHLSTTYPGVNPSNSTINMINQFLDWVQEQQNVWIVSNEQLLAWVKNPVPISQLDTVEALKCSTPQVDCSRRRYVTGYRRMRTGCCRIVRSQTFRSTPATDAPTSSPRPTTRTQLKKSPTGNKRASVFPPIAPHPSGTRSAGNVFALGRVANGANLTGGGTGPSDPSGSPSAASYVPFNGRGFALPSGALYATLFGAVGALIGVFGVVGMI
ncbi:hypothetical protein FB45DRAFT_876987 [Roridomyces roridus]|uniref:Chitin deacetylase n=1 Tax=Roridomyces roridus TaxID=1738132 RepID=A0AAD7B3C8_9AGAR|nr:hypothetical protein FB45DRAFT_876987 [Roridomyces roridus]